MKQSCAILFLGSVARLAAADNDGWWGRDARPVCADQCYRSFRREGRQTAYCTDQDLASSVRSCVSSACPDATRAVADFVSATSSVCSVWSGCRAGATQTLTITRGRGDDDDDDDDDDRRPARTTTAVITGCPNGLWGGWGIWGGWGFLDRDDLDRDDWRGWCRDRDGWNCRTRETTVTVTLTPSAGASTGAAPAVTTAVQTVIQAISGTVTQGTTVGAEAAAENTSSPANDDNNSTNDSSSGNDGKGAGATVGVHFAGMMLALFVAVAGVL